MIIIPIILLLVAAYIVFFFNGLKTTQVQITAAIQEIGNQLKRQSQLIPNLIESTKGYLKHEKGIFDSLTQARKLIDNATSDNPQSIDKAQNSISQVLKSLQVIVESNPEIKASTIVSDLMNELRDTADKIMYSRRTLIDLTADFNIKISTIPGIWIAPILGFHPQKGLETPTSGEFLTVSDTDATTPKVKLD